MSESVLPSVDITRGPTGAFPVDLIAFSEKYCDVSLIPGEVLSFPKIKPRIGLEFVKAKVIPFPENLNRDEGIHVDTAISVTVHVDCNSTGMIENDMVTDDLKKKLSNWLTNDSDYMEILSCEVSARVSGSFYIHHVVTVVVLCDEYVNGDWIGDIIESPFLDEVWNKYMDSIITEGVCYVHGEIPVVLRDSLRSCLEVLAKKTHVDFHPNSNEIIRDLVHPALYPYIKGVSKTITQFTPVSSNEKFDFWGRPYEDSEYQWLPAPFQVTENGECTIQEYINNLDRGLFPHLYKEIERLFELFLPYFEEVWSYAKAITLFRGEEDDIHNDECEDSALEKETVSFKGREFQVITKIVEYNLKPGQSYEGVWHAEGMSHENIVMTGIYFLDRDSDISGGDIKFKRAFTVSERNKVFWNVPQDRPALVNKTAEEGFLPLGRFPTKEGYLLVFPNCHVHKIAKMTNTSNNKISSRRIIVFFFVNPEKKIISTREVPLQQDVIGLVDAKAYRLELMAERKYDKEKLNVRNIELCEH